MLITMETGGGSGAVDTTHGEETLTASAVIDIDTGLSEVSRFEMFTDASYSTNVFFDKTVNASKYIGLWAQKGSSSGACAEYNLDAGDSLRIPIIKSITGGVVKIQAPSNSVFIGTAYWYAS